MNSARMPCQREAQKAFIETVTVACNAADCTALSLPTGAGAPRVRADYVTVKLNHGVSGAKGFLTTTLATAPPYRRFCRKMLTTSDNCEKLYFGVATAQPNARTSKQRDLVLSITAVLNLKLDFGRMHLRGHSIEITLFDISVRLLTFSQKPTLGGSRR